ncbi:MAG: NAD(P)/FAD-dependent oxidoreductase, partial [Phycisphaerae bacterium]
MAKRSETHVDALIIGGGFSGSLLAMILARRGLRVTLIERGSHPRFAIGESSTPTGSMALRRIADTYDLPMLHPFTSYGDWIIRHPNIACGSKRGFSYFFHTPDTPFEPRADHANELLVAASASEKEADTHWYRADVDHFLFEQARALGATCLEETTVEQAELTEQWNVKLNVRGEPISVRADLTIDASGPDSVMSRVLGIRE